MTCVGVLALSCGTVRSQDTNQSSAHPMDQTSTQVAGPYQLPNGLKPDQREKTLSEIRAFLWEAVTQNRSAELRATFYTLEGEPTSYIFYIAKTDSPPGCIRADITSQQSSSASREKRSKPSKTSLQYCQIVRLEAATGARIPEKQRREAGTYRLRLRDRSKNQELTL
jgi:hypothetical protein